MRKPACEHLLPLPRIPDPAGQAKENTEDYQAAAVHPTTTRKQNAGGRNSCARPGKRTGRPFADCSSPTPLEPEPVRSRSCHCLAAWGDVSLPGDLEGGQAVPPPRDRDPIRATAWPPGV